MDTVGLFQTCLTATETVAGENLEQLATAEATVKSLQAQNQAFLDHVDDIENKSRRSNFRTVNIPEGRKNSKDLVKFISELLVECMLPEVSWRGLHGVLPQNRKTRTARPFVVFFLCF